MKPAQLPLRKLSFPRRREPITLCFNEAGAIQPTVHSRACAEHYPEFLSSKALPRALRSAVPALLQGRKLNDYKLG
jgi:hypothetical protein